MARVCNAREPNGVLRCERDFGHNGDHQAVVPTRTLSALSEGSTRSWPSARGERADRSQARAKVNQESAKQAYRRGRLDGIRDERLAEQADRYRKNEADAPNWCEVCGHMERADRLVLHHLIPRAHGVRATEEAQGDERPEDLVLIGPDCHRKEHPGPWPK